MTNITFGRKPTICIECVYYKSKEQKDFCNHPSFEGDHTLDYVTGHKSYKTKTPFPFCKDINKNGKCKLFKKFVLKMRGEQ